MKKDELKRQVEGTFRQFGNNDLTPYELRVRILELLDQLDEPETIEETIHLLESVLKENKRLGKLLEEKHEEWFELMDEINNQEKLSKEWIDENKSLINGRSTNPDGTEGECYDAHYIHVLELQNLLVPTLSEMETVEITEEPETVADVVSTFWKSYERLKEVMGMEVEELEE